MEELLKEAGIVNRGGKFLIPDKNGRTMRERLIVARVRREIAEEKSDGESPMSIRPCDNQSSSEACQSVS